ncbi:MAG: hypothetical protein QF675_08620, partial [SAR324 cluster bacterium]|nr:hypothetical protein [SAR324 cluster bacterium]
NLTLFFKTSERILGVDETFSTPELKPEVEFISVSVTGVETIFSTDVSRNNTGEDQGLLWKAVLDVDSSTHSGLAEFESDLGFRITVRDPSGNERELGFDAAGISSDSSQPTEAPAKMARVDFNTPEVLEFSLKTSNQELNTSGYSWFDLDPSEEGEQWELKPFHNTQLAGWNDTFTLKFSTSERISTSTDLGGSRKPVVIFLPQEIYGTEGIEAQTVSLQETDDNGTLWKAELLVDRSDPEFSEADTFVGFEIQVTDKSGNLRKVRFLDDGDGGGSERLTQRIPSGSDAFVTVNTSGQRARVDTSPPFVGSHATFSTTNIIKTGRNKDPNRSNTFTASAGDQIIFHFNTSEPVLNLDVEINDQAVEVYALEGCNCSPTMFCLWDEAYEILDGIKECRSSEPPWDPRNSNILGDNESLQQWVAIYEVQETDTDVDNVKFVVKSFEDPVGNQFPPDQISEEFKQNYGVDDSILSSFEITSDHFGYSVRIDTTEPEVQSVTLTSTNQGIDEDFPTKKIIRVGDNITLDFNTSEPISGYGSGYNPEGQPILESCTIQEGIPGGYGHCEHDVVLSLLPKVFFTGPDGFRREASVSGSNDSWKAVYPVDPLKDDNLSLDLDYEITITDTSGNEKQYLSVDD